MKTANGSVRVHWPRCPEHDVKLALRPEVQVGSPWSCPRCGAIDVTQEPTERT